MVASGLVLASPKMAAENRLAGLGIPPDGIPSRLDRQSFDPRHRDAMHAASKGLGMRFRLALIGAILLLAGQPGGAQSVEEVRKIGADTPALPEDLFRLRPGSWAFAKELWAGDDPCTADQCEGGYTSGDMVVSVERAKTYVRIVAGFRGCGSVAWNEYEIGKKASKSDTRAIEKNMKRAAETSAEYCKVVAPVIAAFDARQLFPVPLQPAQ